MSAESVAPLAQGEPQAHSGGWYQKQAKLAPYLFTAPFFILFFVFFLFPSIAALVLSFFKWNGISTPEFIGLRNFQRLFTDPDFWQATFNTILYMLASLLIIIPSAMVLAALLNSRALKLRGLWRSTYFTPIVTSSVAIALVFTMLYSTDYGLLNAGLQAIGLPKINWLGDGTWAKVSVIILLVWRWTGYNTIYFLAGMQSIPLELYEAAEIDGAGERQQFLRVTVPLLRPVLLYTVILSIIGSWQIFDEPFVLTSGGPANATLSVAQYLYIHGIRNLRFGLGSAVGLLLFGVIFSLSAVQMRAMGIFRED
jgi:ABC-type sugar transport system permease subunit